MQKKEKVVNILQKNNLDCVFLFGTKNDARYSSWLLGIEPLLYHYVVVMKTGEIKILEIDYLAESLGENVQEMIYPVDEENLFAEAIKSFISENSLQKIGLVGLAPFQHFFGLGLEIIVLNQEINNLLVEKSEPDIKKISKNAKQISKMLSGLRFKNFVGKSEMENAKIIKTMGEKWSNQESFPTSVMSGKRLRNATAGLPTKSKIKNSDMVCVDCGFYANGVHTDITRMYFGKNDKREEIYSTLVKIHKTVIKNGQAGKTLGEISSEYKKLFVENFGEILFEEGDLGHSIGFGLHEEPIFVQKDNIGFKIQNGHVFTLEPEIKVGEYRYRVEDMVACINNKFVILTK